MEMIDITVYDNDQSLSLIMLVPSLITLLASLITLVPSLITLPAFFHPRCHSIQAARFCVGRNELIKSFSVSRVTYNLPTLRSSIRIFLPTLDDDDVVESSSSSYFIILHLKVYLLGIMIAHSTSDSYENLCKIG